MLSSSLKIGSVLFARLGMKEMLVHDGFGMWDRACVPSARQSPRQFLGIFQSWPDFRYCRIGVAARLRRAAQATYFDGVKAERMASM
jgi:hypothetical protein